MQFLKYNTAATVLMGPFVDKTDGVTPETGLAAGTVDEIGIYKHDATALTSIAGTTTFTHRAGGMYTMTLSATDTNTVGRMTAYVRDDSVCLPCWKDFMVLPAIVFDALVLGTDALQVHANEITNGLITAAAIADGAIDAATFAAGAIDAAAIAANAIDADAIAANAITAAKIATDAITSDELAASALTEIADAVLKRDVANVEATASTNSLTELILAAFEHNIVGVTMTIYRTNHLTTFNTRTITKDATAAPITGVT